MIKKNRPNWSWKMKTKTNSITLISTVSPMTSNSTSCYREGIHMEAMGRAVTRMKEVGNHITFNSMRIWMRMRRMGWIRIVTTVRISLISITMTKLMKVICLNTKALT